MSTNGKKDGIHVVGIEVENLHRIRVALVKLLPGGGLVRVTGKNRSGKTSLLTTIKEAFGGAGAVTAVPIHAGADAGFVKVELSNGFTVTRKITEKNPKGFLTVIAPDGGKHSQSKLTEWMGTGSFDPLAFFTLKPERQREILLGLGKDPELAAKLDDVRERHAKLYAERTPFISEQQRCRRVQKPTGERPAPIDVSAAMEELRGLQSQERDRGDLEREARSLVDSLRQNDQAQLKSSNRITELEEQLGTERANLAMLKSQQEGIERVHRDYLERIDATPPVGAAIAAVQDRITSAEAVNRSLEPWREWERAHELLKAATKSADELTAKLGATKSEELKLIADSGIPVPGLTFHPETCEPLLEGFPLELASGGERIRLAVAVALAVDPELRIALVDEANDLDLDALQELDRLAQAHDFQVFACRIGIESPGEIVVEDGEASSPAAVAVAS